MEKSDLSFLSLFALIILLFLYDDNKLYYFIAFFPCYFIRYCFM